MSSQNEGIAFLFQPPFIHSIYSFVKKCKNLYETSRQSRFDARYWMLGVYMYHSFLIHSSADGHLGAFHVLAMADSY